MGGGIGGKMGLEMTTLTMMPRSAASWLTIASGVSEAMSTEASAAPPVWLTTMRAVTLCSSAPETVTLVPPIVSDLPYGSSAVRRSLAFRARVWTTAKFAACRRRRAALASAASHKTEFL